MPYVTPPTFSTNQILTASQLNVLSGDIEYLNSITDYINVPFSKYVYGTAGVQSMSEAKWLFFHRHAYLHYYMTIDTGDLDAPVKIMVNWGTGLAHEVFTRSSSLTSPQTIAGYVDMQDYIDTNDPSPETIPAGAKLEVYWDALTDGTATAHYFFESAFTSI